MPITLSFEVRDISDGLQDLKTAIEYMEILNKMRGSMLDGLKNKFGEKPMRYDYGHAERVRYIQEYFGKPWTPELEKELYDIREQWDKNHAFVVNEIFNVITDLLVKNEHCLGKKCKVSVSD